MHRFVRSADAAFRTPSAYTRHSSGYSRASLVDGSTGSVHMGEAIGQLEPGGFIDRHVHAYEVMFYVLEGEVIVELAGVATQLGSGNYGVIQSAAPHSWRNPGPGRARWLEFLAPQPKSPKQARDTYFLGAGAPETAASFEPGPLTRFLGRFEDDSRTPGLGIVQTAFPGLSLRQLVDHRLGAIHMSMFIPQLEGGEKLGAHDHPFEESYFFISGEVTITLDGIAYPAHPGDFAWSGVGGSHAFAIVGDVPGRWIEAQVPQPPRQQAMFSFSQWEQLANRSS